MASSVGSDGELLNRQIASNKSKKALCLFFFVEERGLLKASTSDGKSLQN
jgi:hypothetical protein